MSWLVCPVCDRNNPPGTHRCTACGADFDDPDVRALAEAPAARPGEDAGRRGGGDLVGERGALADSRFLGFSLEGLRDGPSLRRLAVIGCALAAAAFAVPVAAPFESFRMPWTAMHGGPAFALIFPLAAALAGLAVAAAPAVPAAARAAVLTIAGAVGVAACLPGLGRFAGAPTALVPVFTAGMLAAGVGAGLRLYRPELRAARLLLVAGAVLAVAGLAIPISHTVRALPIEFRLLGAKGKLAGASPLAAAWASISRDPVILFTALYFLLPVVLVPGAAALAWPTPVEAWDKRAKLLRPLAWMIVLYIPLGYALYLFNMTGWSGNLIVVLDGHWARFEDFAQQLMVGRARLLALSWVFAIWAQLGGIALWEALRRPAPTQPKTG